MRFWTDLKIINFLDEARGGTSWRLTKLILLLLRTFWKCEIWTSQQHITANKNNQNSKVCMGSCRSFHMNKMLLKIWSCWLCMIFCIQRESHSCFNPYNICYHPVNMLDPIHIWSALVQKCWPEAGLMILAYWLASGPDPFGPNLMQSARTKLDHAGFAQYDLHYMT